MSARFESATPTPEAFASYFRREIEAFGLSVTEAARRSGVPRSRMYEFTSAKAMPRLEQLNRFILECGPKPSEDLLRDWTDYWREVKRKGGTRPSDGKSRQLVHPDKGLPRSGTGLNASLELSDGRPRLLVVEDQIGPKIVNLFGDLQCHLIRSLEEFWVIANKANEFDAALVDLHLTLERIDKEGLIVVEWLAHNSATPAILMTAKLGDNMLVAKMIAKYNLVEVCTKSADMEGVREAVRDALSPTVQSHLIRKLKSDLPRRQELAMARIMRGSSDGATRESLAAAMNHVRQVCDDGTLADVRAAVHGFDLDFLS